MLPALRPMKHPNSPKQARDSMSNISTVISEIRSQLPPQTRLAAVSKYHPAQMVQEAYDAGQRIFAESHVQELQQKYPILPKDIEWHFIGHLQSNKVKYIAPYISLIHSVDSPKLLLEINKQATKCGRTIPCLLQLHLAQEETKFGFTLEECRTYLQSGEWRSMEGVHLVGIMCMASNTDDEQQISREFDTAHAFFQEVKDQYFANDDDFSIRSWGMSDDYPIAIQHGSTLVRVGSKIFGPRVY